MVPLTAFSSMLDSLHNSNDTEVLDPNHGNSAYSSVKMLELSELTSHITLSQISSCGSFTEQLGLPRLYERADLRAAMQVDEFLNRWERSLPLFSQSDAVQDDIENCLRRQHILLSLQ